VGNYVGDDKGGDEMLAIRIDDFLQEEWGGTATELCNTTCPICLTLLVQYTISIIILIKYLQF